MNRAKIDNLREAVCEANLELVRHGLVIHSWGNVSARDPETGLIVIK
ncbi:MAG TPA: class II aldolase/adducin family protein, partial [Bacteroidales bacterium]|nr:class II aldolase/adducin family protein [Bacteroidales bacterium]